MTLPITTHFVPPEDYAYLSGFLKAKEVRFLNSEDYVVLSRLMNLTELVDFMNKHGYKIHYTVLEPAQFESNLWIPFKNEIYSVSNLVPEPYLVAFIILLRKILFWKRDERLLTDFKELAKKGTVFTQSLSKLVIDRFNFFEKIRSLLNKSPDWHYEEGGNFDLSSLNQIFDTSLKNLDRTKEYYAWKSFFERESSSAVYDFDFMKRLDTYWKSIINITLIQPNKLTYGLDYCISYFVKWILEIESLLKVYFTLRFTLPYDLREELYLHVR